MWCIPPEQNAEFVARMEDVLEVYSRPYDTDYPVVCMDEKPYQLLDDRIKPIKMDKTNHKKKVDCEYERQGSCSIFIFTEPLGGWRDVIASPQRTSEDWANRMKWLADEVYYNAKKIVLVMDNLNTHTTASFYKVFSPEEAFRLSQRYEIHYTPKHGSWLNMAELELSSLSIQCLGERRIKSLDDLNLQLSAWRTYRNAAQKGIDWQFTAADARIKLKHLYPIVKV
jgi:hypothetical protein